MIKKVTNNVKSDYVLLILLLVFSGDPIMRFMDKSAILILALLILVVKYKEISKDFFSKIFIIISSLLVLFILQFFTLNFISWLGAFRYMSLFLFGGLIFNLIGERFSYRFFIAIYYASLISLFGFVIINLVNFHPPGLVWGDKRVTYFVYTFVEEHHYRNCGMFWEPGAFAGILTLCVALNLKYLPELWKKHKFKILVIVVALLTTKSTTGYLVFFTTVIYYIIFFVRNALIKMSLIPGLLITIFVVYEKTDFLKEKLTNQSASSQSIIKGQFINTRFGSFMLDLHYIKKHPFVGNGLNEITRYADDPMLIQRLAAGDNLANANGFSNYIACLGIPFMFFYLLSSFIAINKVDLRVAVMVIFVILLSLWGEQWLSFPIFAGIMFIKIKK